MKTKLKIFVVFLSVLTISSCEKSEFSSAEEVSSDMGNISKTAQPVAKTYDKLGISNIAQAVYHSKYTMDYIGNNRWTGYYSGINLTFSGCTPADLANNLAGAFFTIQAQGGALLSFESGVLNVGSVTLCTLMGGSFQAEVYGYQRIKDANGNLLSVWGLHTDTYITATGSSGAGSITIPYKIIIVDSKPYLVHPKYTTFSVLPELID